MKKLMMLAACAAMFAGCSVTKVEYETNKDGVVSYRLYRNSHWLKMEGEGMRGGMTANGRFEFDLEGMKSSPSEEFNRTMQTYTTAFVQLAQIAAAAYNPSSSAAISKATATEEKSSATALNAVKAADTAATSTPVNICTGEPLKGANCKDGKCEDTCTDGSCTDTSSSDAAKASAK